MTLPDAERAVGILTTRVKVAKISEVSARLDELEAKAATVTELLGDRFPVPRPC